MQVIDSRVAATAREGLAKVVTLYDKKPKKYMGDIIGQTFTDRQKYMEVAQTGDFGMAAEVNEGTGVPTDDFDTINAKQYTPIMRAIGFSVSEQALVTDLYKIVGNYAEKIAKAMNKTQEQVAANIINLMADSSTTGPDGQPLLSTAHPLASGTTANTGSVGLALGTPNLETAIQELIKQKSHRGDPMPVDGPFRLFVHPDRAMLADRLVKATKYPTDNSNQGNPAGARIADVSVNPYFTNSYSWLLRSMDDDEHGMFMLKRISRKTKEEYETRLLSWFFVCFEEYIAGFYDWRGCWGSSGTA
jgi:hypothetical protein